MPLLTELEFIPFSNYRDFAPDGASDETQGIQRVPWDKEPHFVVGVSSRAKPPMLLNPQEASMNHFSCVISRRVGA